MNDTSLPGSPRIRPSRHWLAAATLLLVSACRGPEPPAAPTASDAVHSPAADVASLPRSNLTLADRARWLARLHWPADCEQAFAQTRLTDDAGLHFQELEPGLSIVVVRCALGAYQPTHLVLRLDERRAPAAVTVLEFASFESEDGRRLTPARVTELVGELTLLDGGRTLTLLSLARQLGDCGTWARYRLGAEPPQLEIFAERVACPDAPGERAEPRPGEPPAGWQRVTQP